MKEKRKFIIYDRPVPEQDNEADLADMIADHVEGRYAGENSVFASPMEGDGQYRVEVTVKVKRVA